MVLLENLGHLEVEVCLVMMDHLDLKVKVVTGEHLVRLDPRASMVMLVDQVHPVFKG